ncbi:hypothetical protein CF641_37205, partial [Burkholderia pseudomallei]
EVGVVGVRWGAKLGGRVLATGVAWCGRRDYVMHAMMVDSWTDQKLHEQTMAGHTAARHSRGQVLPLRVSLLAMLGISFVRMLVALGQTVVGTAVPTTVWPSATSILTKEMPSIASSDTRNGRTCPLECRAAVWPAIVCSCNF